MFALVDCNNFFVSCERTFQPELEGKPVVVLSNNDGVVVSRSNESKAMGIGMCTPFFKIRHLAEKGLLAVRSSNYTMYGDISARVMSILAETAPRLEVYSIDEAYMDFTGVRPELVPILCHGIVEKVRRWTGIPVSVGVAPTKTLAKVANHFAKNYKGYKGVCVIDSEAKRLKALELTPIGDVWGIGWRSAPKLRSVGVATALDFVSRPEAWVRKRMGVAGVRTWSELQGSRMVEEENNEKRKSICVSRSFAGPITDYDELSARISDYAGKCAEKLRSEGSAARTVSVFARTDLCREDLPRYSQGASLRLDVPANDSPSIIGSALKALRMIYKPGYKYKKAGVVMEDIIEASSIQQTLFDFDPEARQKDNVLSSVMDKFNKDGKNVLRLATQRPGHYSDGMRHEYMSKLYSTDWKQLLEVK